jgi:protein-S-isoprenylcysteine O-methyltransferase Ste14
MKKSLLQKLPATSLALVLYYVLPLLGRLDLLFTFMLLVPMALCAVVYMTQPAATADQVNQRQDRHSMKFLIGATTVSQVSIMIDWAYFHLDHSFQLSWTTVTGFGLMQFGLGLRLWAIKELREFFTNHISIHSDHQLIQTGPFAVLRHPAYAGAYLLAIGIGLFLSSWIGVILTVTVLGAAYQYRIVQEEQALEARFGETYRTYRKKTWKMVTFIW